MNVESSANETAKTCQPMVCVKTQLSAQLRLKWDDNEGGRAAPVAGEQPPIFQFLLLSPQDQNPKVPTGKFLIIFFFLKLWLLDFQRFKCWISHACAFSAQRCVFFSSVLPLSGKPRSVPANPGPGQRSPLPPWSPVTRPHLELRFFSGQN